MKLSTAPQDIDIDVSHAVSKHSSLSKHNKNNWDGESGGKRTLLDHISVIEIWNIVIGVSTVTLRCIVGYPEVIEPRKENQYSYDEDRNRSISISDIEVPRQEQGPDGDQQGAN